MPTKTQQKIQAKSKVQAELQQMQQVQSELKGLFACFFFFLGGGGGKPWVGVAKRNLCRLHFKNLNS